MLRPEPGGQQFSHDGRFLDLDFLSGVAVDELAVFGVVEGDYAAAGRLNICTDAVSVAIVSPGPVPAVTRHPTLFFP